MSEVQDVEIESVWGRSLVGVNLVCSVLGL